MADEGDKDIWTPIEKVENIFWESFHNSLSEISRNNLAYCSDFRYESNGIFVLGVGFFFFRQISTF